MINQSVAIAALARNCEENLPRNIERIMVLRKHFSSSAVFLYENNSTDRTKAILKEWQAKEAAVYLLSEDIDESVYKTEGKVSKLYRGTSEGRILKMCDCRNKLLNLIRSQGRYDYVIFVDIDVEWFSVDGIVKTIKEAPEGWSALFSNCYVTYRNGSREYDYPQHYDTFAFLEKGKQLSHIKHKELNPFRRVLLAKKIYKEVNSRTYCECESAFGGIGIYKGDKIEGLKYELYKPDSWGETGSTLCEHIWFNARLAGKKYISQELKVRYQRFDISRLRWTMVNNASVLYSLLGTVKSLMN